ncbi:MAG: hypothetical protein K1X55_05665 [Chitinophagales bacterium]|nr:hypothetical protein [Chitinophagales bacterium]
MPHFRSAAYLVLLDIDYDVLAAYNYLGACYAPRYPPYTVLAPIAGTNTSFTKYCSQK